MNYAGAARTQSLDTLPGCPAMPVKDFLRKLDSMPAFTLDDNVVEAIGSCGSRCQPLLSWMKATYGQTIIEATGTLKVPGFRDNVLQFIVTKPNAEL